MLENLPPSASDPPAAVVKRYAPPNQRNRSFGRRKPGERLDRTNNPYAVDGDKIAPRNMNDHRGTAFGNFLNEVPQPGLIPLEGCCSSEAYQLLNDRWAAAIHSYNDTSLDLSARPVIYSGSSASVWGHNRLPHQLISPGGTGMPSSQMDFMAELQQAMHGAK
ncbi:hypothetical protein SAY87_006532 [Trapa incisa]|uniref:Uncharacterized protein n=2 Tax=Trapa TaxID=22665 RepID=A0AAN7L1A6_TRANT|nr:hypothetical protein SAY87_006532 [Trapa incisa]KAK4774278.1 hypothetical protein SAY86_009213 [Trapa natans]